MKNSMRRCRVCAQNFIEKPLLRYEDMPAVAQNFPTSADLKEDRGVNLEVVQCSSCGLVQLNTEPVPYYRDVIRAAAFSPEMGEFRQAQFLEFVNKYRLLNKKIIEIGCGRGEYLSLMKKTGALVFGIEHLNSSVQECHKNDLQVSEAYIEDADYKIPYGPFDAFFILNFLEHIPNINSFLKGIAGNLKNGAVGLVEVPNFDMILRNKMFSEFMTDHLYYFTTETLISTLNLNGFEVLDTKEVWHSYILSAEVRKRPVADLSAFDEFQKQLRCDLEKYLNRFPSRSVAVWGAGHQALAVISLSKLKERLKFVVDSAPFKQGKYTPATHLPIVSPATLKEDNTIKAIVIMAASYSDEVARQIRSQFGSRFQLAIVRPEGLEIVGF